VTHNLVGTLGRTRILLLPMQANAVVLGGPAAKNFGRTVGRAVIQNDELKVAIGLVEDAFDCLVQIWLRVVDGQYDAEQDSASAGSAPKSLRKHEKLTSGKRAWLFFEKKAFTKRRFQRVQDKRLTQPFGRQLRNFVDRRCAGAR